MKNEKYQKFTIILKYIAVQNITQLNIDFQDCLDELKDIKKVVDSNNPWLTWSADATRVYNLNDIILRYKTYLIPQNTFLNKKFLDKESSIEKLYNKIPQQFIEYIKTISSFQFNNTEFLNKCLEDYKKLSDTSEDKKPFLKDDKKPSDISEDKKLFLIKDDKKPSDISEDKKLFLIKDDKKLPDTSEDKKPSFNNDSKYIKSPEYKSKPEDKHEEKNKEDNDLNNKGIALLFMAGFASVLVITLLAKFLGNKDTSGEIDWGGYDLDDDSVSNDSVNPVVDSVQNDPEVML